jgi:hypothetical protein
MTRRRTDALKSTASQNFTRRAWLGSAAGGAALLVLGGRFLVRDAEARTPITVYKDPNCGCCGNWVLRMRESGFEPTVHDIPDVARIKREQGVTEKLYSCHTSVAGDYAFEGHVPPDLVARVLRDRPAIAGLAVPGMPASAPGMETGAGVYEVLSFTRDGTTAVFAVRS